MVQKSAVVLLSGGIDSTTTMAIAKADGFEIYALSFDYGQRHKIELEAAKKVAKHFKALRHLIIEIPLRNNRWFRLDQRHRSSQGHSA